ncbi:MAG: PilZ domain-containing protein [Myxococcales bacterium]|nr:PilZ domain-containing protein [Myxococcales bacterium]
MAHTSRKGGIPGAVDRRTEVRRTVNREFASVDEFIAEYVSNLSRSGVFIRSDDPLPVGTKVTLRFTVIMEELETIEGVGEVVRVVPSGGQAPAGMGVVFVELTNVSRQLVEKILVRR